MCLGWERGAVCAALVPTVWLYTDSCVRLMGLHSWAFSLCRAACLCHDGSAKCQMYVYMRAKCQESKDNCACSLGMCFDVSAPHTGLTGRKDVRLATRQVACANSTARRFSSWALEKSEKVQNAAASQGFATLMLELIIVWKKWNLSAPTVQEMSPAV